MSCLITSAIIQYTQYFQFHTQCFIIIDYRHSVLFDIKYQCSATTHICMKKLQVHGYTCFKTSKINTTQHSPTIGCARVCTRHWEVWYYSCKDFGAELRNNNSAVEAITCSSHNTIAALSVVSLAQWFSQFSHLLQAWNLYGLSCKLETWSVWSFTRNLSSVQHDFIFEESDAAIFTIPRGVV